MSPHRHPRCYSLRRCLLLPRTIPPVLQELSPRSHSPSLCPAPSLPLPLALSPVNQRQATRREVHVVAYIMRGAPSRSRQPRHAAPSERSHVRMLTLPFRTSKPAPLTTMSRGSYTPHDVPTAHSMRYTLWVHCLSPRALSPHLHRTIVTRRGALCLSWRSAVSPPHTHMPPRPTSLLLPQHPPLSQHVMNALGPFCLSKARPFDTGRL